MRLALTSTNAERSALTRNAPLSDGLTPGLCFRQIPRVGAFTQNGKVLVLTHRPRSRPFRDRPAL